MKFHIQTHTHIYTTHIQIFRYGKKPDTDIDTDTQHTPTHTPTHRKRKGKKRKRN